MPKQMQTSISTRSSSKPGAFARKNWSLGHKPRAGSWRQEQIARQQAGSHPRANVDAGCRARQAKQRSWEAHQPAPCWDLHSFCTAWWAYSIRHQETRRGTERASRDFAGRRRRARQPALIYGWHSLTCRAEAVRGGRHETALDTGRCLRKDSRGTAAGFGRNFLPKQRAECLASIQALRNGHGRTPSGPTGAPGSVPPELVSRARVVAGHGATIEIA